VDDPRPVVVGGAHRQRLARGEPHDPGRFPLRERHCHSRSVGQRLLVIGKLHQELAFPGFGRSQSEQQTGP